MKKIITAFLFLSAMLALFPVIAFADVPIVTPDGDPLQSLLALFMNWKAMGPLAIGSAFIVAAVQALKKLFPEFPYKRGIVTVLGVAYGVLTAVTQGMGLGAALIAALLTSGGAVAIYEALKPLFSKLKIG
jgi:hypothetical protein